MKKRTRAASKRRAFRVPANAAQVPATQGMLLLVRRELKADIAGFRSESSARFKETQGQFKEVDARFKEADARFDRIDARFNQVDARFDRMDATLAEMKGSIHRIELMVEEQNARNRIVLEGLSGLFHRQERVEARVDAVEAAVRSLKPVAPTSV